MDTLARFLVLTLSRRFALEYYFELRRDPDQAWLYPGFNATLSNQPYFLVRQPAA